jgi:hypothetical protein
VAKFNDNRGITPLSNAVVLASLIESAMRFRPDRSLHEIRPPGPRSRPKVRLSLTTFKALTQLGHRPFAFRVSFFNTPNQALDSPI